MKELSLLLLLLAITTRVLSLSCPGPCVRSDCALLQSQDCLAGLARDVCGCCDECAKGVGEVCGGPWNTAGFCGKGLFCRKEHLNIPGSEFNAQGKCLKDLPGCEEGEPTFCTFDQIPKCGSNGVNYENSCEFASAQCKNPDLVEMPCDVGPSCIEGTSWKDECNDCFCNNGLAACTLQLCQPGPDPPCPEPLCRCSPDEEVNVFINDDGCNGCSCVPKPRNCGRICAAIYSPVCGSDGETYGNECSLEEAQCRNPSLMLEYNGECIKNGNCGGICAAIYSPVCGSDGKTYGNKCSLEGAQCRNPSLKLEYNGECIKNEPRCEAPGSGCPNGACKERCDYENGEYNSPFQSCGGSNCTCCVAAATCDGNGSPCEGVIGGTCRGECELDEEEQGSCSAIAGAADAIQCLCCRKVRANNNEFTLDFERFILLDEHKGVTWQQARNLCNNAGYELAEPQIDVTRLATYLLTNYGLTYYWVGGRGQGENIAWLSGQGISRFSPLWRNADQGGQSSTNFCMYIRDDGNPNPLGTYNCQDTTYLTPLCEAKELPPPPPASPGVAINFS